MNRSAAHGFTLIEVIVALLVVAISMAALLTALSSATDAAVAYRERVFAEWIGFNQITLAREAPTAPATGITTGYVDMANNHWQWQQDVEPFELPEVLKITVRVRLAPRDEKSAPDKPHWSATVVGFKGTKGNSGSGTTPNWQGTALPS